MDQSYQLLDSGHGRKLEKFGPYILSRPCSQAVWRPSLSLEEWEKADAIFSRQQENKWTYKRSLPSEWSIEVAQIMFKIAPTDFGHLGIFPEQQTFWLWIQQILNKAKKKRSSIPKVLNLFAYSGGATLAAAKVGASVCHLDASKGMVTWARENAQLNQLETSSIRWIVDDVQKFLTREIKRGSRYDAIILDPPSFGRGAKGELFKIEEDIIPLLNDCKVLLSEQPLFMLFSCHTPGFSPLVMQHLLTQTMQEYPGYLDVGEMILTGYQNTVSVPSGTYARWIAEV